MDQKLLMGGSDEALRKARKAHELASRLTSEASKSVFGLWAAIAAYRLAHLKLRFAQSTEALHDVDALFREAARSDLLGAYPHLYRIPVLLRLRQASDVRSESETVQSAIDREFRHARNKIVQQTRTLAPTCESPQDGPDPIQTNLFNLLEFAIYAAGANYSQLEGLGLSDGASRWLDQQERSNAYVMLGGSDYRIRMPYELAKAELEARAQDQPRALWFEYVDPSTGRSSSWSHGPGTASEERIRMLAQLLNDPTRLGDLHEDYTGAPSSLRVAVQRLRKHLGVHFGVDGKHVIKKSSREISRTAYELNTRYPIFGIAHLATLNASRA
jgi:hypothetical protein